MGQQPIQTPPSGSDQRRHPRSRQRIANRYLLIINIIAVFGIAIIGVIVLIISLSKGSSSPLPTSTPTVPITASATGQANPTAQAQANATAIEAFV